MIIRAVWLGILTLERSKKKHFMLYHPIWKQKPHLASIYFLQKASSKKLGNWTKGPCVILFNYFNAFALSINLIRPQIYRLDLGENAVQLFVGKKCVRNWHKKLHKVKYTVKSTVDHRYTAKLIMVKIT